MFQKLHSSRLSYSSCALALALSLGIAFTIQGTSPRSQRVTDAPSEHAARTREVYRDHAGEVFDRPTRIETRSDGIALRSADRVVTRNAAVDRRGADAPTRGTVNELELTLPSRGEGAARFRLADGSEIQVEETELHGAASALDGAVSYARPNGRSYWTTGEVGFEEWLAIDAGNAYADRPIATWTLRAGVPERRGDAVVVRDAQGAPRLRVTAPRAWNADGEPVRAELRVDGSRIALVVDADGAEVLVDPWWVCYGSLPGRSDETFAALLPDERVLVVSSSSSLAWVYDPSANAFISIDGPSGLSSDASSFVLPDGRVLLASAGNDVQYYKSFIFDLETLGWSEVPPNPELVDIHALTLLLDGRLLAVGHAWNDGSTAYAQVYDPVTNAWSSAGALSEWRDHPTATRLTDGTVLVAGGYDPGVTLPSNDSFSTAESYDPETNSWSTTGEMLTRRADHVATRLPNGNVFVVGGNVRTADSNWVQATTAEIYDVPTRSWSDVPAPAIFWHRPVPLPDGRVLFEGPCPDRRQLYSPSTNAWIDPGGDCRTGDATVVMPNGKVLLVGGSNSDSSYNGNWRPVPVAEWFDPSDGTWTPTGSTAWLGYSEPIVALSDHIVTVGIHPFDLTTNAWVPNLWLHRSFVDSVALPNGRFLGFTWSTPSVATVQAFDLGDEFPPTEYLDIREQQVGVTLLESGRVLLTGGEEQFTSQAVTTAHIYDPATHALQLVEAMPHSHAAHSSTRLVDGTVLVVGSFRESGAPFADRFYPGTGHWSAAGTLSTPRVGHTVTVLRDGRVLIAGGATPVASGDYPVLAAAEIYDPVTNSWTTAAPMNARRQAHWAVLRDDGTVMVGGGYGSASAEVLTTEVYDPAADRWTLSTPAPFAIGGASALALPDGRVMLAGGTLFTPFFLEPGCTSHNGGCDPLTTCTEYQARVTCGPCPDGFSGSGATGCVAIATDAGTDAGSESPDAGSGEAGVDEPHVLPLRYGCSCSLAGERDLERPNLGVALAIGVCAWACARSTRRRASRAAT